MSTTRRAAPEEAQQRQTEIIAIATRLFQRDGFEGTPVTRIAKQAGMTPGNLYWYFPSKQDLLKEVLIEQYRSSYAVLEGADDPGRDAAARLANYVRTFVGFQLEGVEAEANFGYLSLQNSLESEAKEELLEWQRRHRLFLKEILRAGVRAGQFVIQDLTVLTSMLITSVEYVFLWFKEDGRLTLQEVADEYASLALRMAGAR